MELISHENLNILLALLAVMVQVMMTVVHNGRVCVGGICSGGG